MTTEPKQPSQPQQDVGPDEPAEERSMGSENADLPESNAAAEEESKSRRRQIKIGSQREGFRPIRQASGIRETWSTDDGPKDREAPAGAASGVLTDGEASAPPAAPPPQAAEAPLAAEGPDSPATTPVGREETSESGADHRIVPPAPVSAYAPTAGEPTPVRPKPPPASAPSVEEVESELPEVSLPGEIGAAPPVPPTRTRPRMPRVSADLQAEIDEALGDMALNDDSFEQMLLGAGTDEAEAELELESRQPGTIVKIHEDDVFFSVGARHEAVASLRQFAEPPEIGTKMDVVINRFNTEEGLYEVTVPGASMKVEDWSDLAEGIVVEAHVTGHNSGGLECTVGQIRGFIPASQISIYRVEDFEEYADQKMQCVVTEVNPSRRNLVLSRRAAIEREREAARQKLWEELEVGQVREGVVRRIQDFGAFVDLGGVDGLIHVSELSWDRVNHPSEVLEEGQTIQVRVEKVDREADRLGLSYRGVMENPWKNAEANYPVNSMVTGTVSRIMQFGAFVKLEPGIEGLVHISELAHHRVTRVSHVLNEGDEVEVKVLSVDADAQRMSLSLKAANPLPQSTPEQKKPEDEVPDGTRERAVPERRTPLKGGVDRPSGGDQFGLKW
jgi:small subunit ribosomal protein S1